MKKNPGIASLQEPATTSSSSRRLLDRNFIRHVPLQAVLIVPFVLQIFAAVGLVGYLSFKNGQRAVNDLALQLQTESSPHHSHSHFKILTSQFKILTSSAKQSQRRSTRGVTLSRVTFWVKLS